MNSSEYVYLDYAATTPMDPQVIDVVEKHFKNTYGNPSSLHSAGQKAAKVLYNARTSIASLINADRKDIIFTSSGTEADNIAIQGVAHKNKDRGNHIITSSIEHHAVENPCKFLMKQGFDVTFLPVDKFGLVDPIKLQEEITNETILISIMFANNEIGTIEPINDIGEIAKDNDVIFHTDAVQAFGKIPIDVKELNIDLLSASAHKIYGPKGVGMLYMKNQGIRQNWGKYIDPIMFGGGHERNMRPSTENVPGIAGFGKAAEICEEELPIEINRQIKLRDRLIKTTLDSIDDSYLNGHPKKRLPNNANFGFKYVEGESILLDLDSGKIAASTGSACSSASLEPSHVLSAIGLTPQDAHGSLRVSIGRFTTEEEIDYFLEKIPPIIERLREISPVRK
ncbi:MAG: aminotransferase class V-fold PLP-dependent enzyme [Candidatus Lokiarchaeota archaeon]|nr:aminotransferase class V-fold PLP-dependent enzyme [Candidatus Lokiarchaeota archaeon]MBD3199306.1 aminotransferase class V-fold PLP-dependent enzyme [Candidatus Lokiarchaeota archaeon]